MSEPEGEPMLGSYSVHPCDHCCYFPEIDTNHDDPSVEGYAHAVPCPYHAQRWPEELLPLQSQCGQEETTCVAAAQVSVILTKLKLHGPSLHAGRSTAQDVGQAISVRCNKERPAANGVEREERVSHLDV